MNQHYKIEKLYLLPFPLKVKEGSIGEPHTLPFDLNLSRNINGKNVTNNYKGMVLIHYPFFHSTPDQKEKDMSGSSFDKDNKPIRLMFSANTIKIEVCVEASSIDKQLAGLKYPGDREEFIKEYVPIYLGSEIESIAERYLEAVLIWVRVKGRQFWIGGPLPEPHFHGVSLWYGPGDVPLKMINHAGSSGFGRYSTQTPLTEEAWQEIGEAISNNQKIGLYEQLLLDAEHMYSLYDNRKAILDLATSFEVFALHKLDKIESKRKHNEGFIDAVDRITADQFRRHLKVEKFPIYQTLRFVYEARNKIIHEGKGDGDKIEIQFKVLDPSSGNEVKKTAKWVIGWSLVHEGIDAVYESIKWFKSF